MSKNSYQFNRPAHQGLQNQPDLFEQVTGLMIVDNLFEHSATWHVKNVAFYDKKPPGLGGSLNFRFL